MVNGVGNVAENSLMCGSIISLCKHLERLWTGFLSGVAMRYDRCVRSVLVRDARFPPGETGVGR